MKASTRWITVCIFFTALPIFILVALPRREDANELAVLCPIWACVYLLMFAGLRRNPQKAAYYFLGVKFPRDSTTPEEMALLLRGSSWCLLVGAVLLLAATGRYVFFMG